MPYRFYIYTNARRGPRPRPVHNDEQLDSRGQRRSRSDKWRHAASCHRPKTCYRIQIPSSRRIYADAIGRLLDRETPEVSQLRVVNRSTLTRATQLQWPDRTGRQAVTGWLRSAMYGWQRAGTVTQSTVRKITSISPWQRPFTKAENIEQVTLNVISLNGLVYFVIKHTGSVQFLCQVKKINEDRTSCPY
jgi:hypothetical protein